MLKNKPSFLEIHKDEDYKWALIDTLTAGIPDQWIEYFEMTMVYVIDEKWKLFDREELRGSIYDGDDDILDLVLPSVRRVFGKIFIDPPKMFLKYPVVSTLPGYKDDGRLELFRLNFDIDEFLDYFVHQIIMSINCLRDFIYIDRTVETLSLIVDNYIAKLVKSVLESGDIKSDIRDLKIKRMIND